MAFFNRVEFNSTTSGTGAFGVGTAVVGFRTPAVAGISNGTPVSYTTQNSDLSQWETGHGTYNTAGPTISRDTVLENSAGNTSPINFTSLPIVRLDLLAQDISGSPLFVTKTSNYTVTSGDSGTTFDNFAAVAEVDFQLPNAVRGQTYHFCVATAQIVKLLAGATATININGVVSAAQGTAAASVVGSFVTVYALNATQWIARSVTGQWQVT
jgi:hypothetical protein